MLFEAKNNLREFLCVTLITAFFILKNMCFAACGSVHFQHLLYNHIYIITAIQHINHSSLEIKRVGR